MKKTKILVECPELISSVKVGVLDLLEDRDDNYLKFVRTIDITEEDVYWADVLVTVRGSEKLTFEIIKLAEKLRKYIIYFLDDDLLNVPLNLISGKYYDNKIIKKNIREILKKSNILWAVNPKIIQKYSKYTKEKKGVLSKVPMRLKKNVVNDIKKLNVLYAASIDHKKNVENILKPVIEKFENEIIKGEITFTFIGANLKMRGVKNYSYFSNYSQYEEFLIKNDFHIGLAPIEKDEFYKCKYHNKYLEYTSMGILGVYTASSPYDDVIKNNMNGFLVENTVESWYNTLDYVLNNKKKILFLSRNAQKDILLNYEIKKVKNDIVKLIPELISYKAPEIEKRYKLKKSMYILDKIILFYQIYGIKASVIIPIKILKKIGERINERIYKRNMER